MTDSRTTELCKLLEERGVEFETHDIITGKAVTWSGSVCNWVALPDEMGLAVAVYKDYLSPEQAIAATLGSEPPYDELLRCLENDWHISASWDGLRKFWCIELTEEGVKLRDATHGTLTAEQVLDAVLENFEETHETRYDHWEPSKFDWQAIADELNAKLGSGTCECVKGKCSNCGKDLPEDPYSNYEGNFCPSCGARIRKAVE